MDAAEAAPDRAGLRPGAPSAGLLLSDALVVDEELRPVGGTLWAARKLTSFDRYLISRGRPQRLMRRNFTATYGPTMALRASYKSDVLPIPTVAPSRRACSRRGTPGSRSSSRPWPTWPW